MCQVIAKPGEDFESLLKRFKKAVEKSGILTDYKKHEVYEKPCVRKRRKRIAAQKRAMKKIRRIQRHLDYADKNKNFKRGNNKRPN